MLWIKSILMQLVPTKCYSRGPGQAPSWMTELAKKRVIRKEAFRLDGVYKGLCPRSQKPHSQLTTSITSSNHSTIATTR